MSYLLALTEGSREHPFATGALAMIWQAIAFRYADFACSDSFFWLLAFWSVGFILGTISALRDSWAGRAIDPLTGKPIRYYPGTTRELNRWSSGRLFQGIARLAVCFCLLCLTFQMRLIPTPGFGPFASLLEAAIFAGFISVALKYAGTLMNARYLILFASTAERVPEQLAQAADDWVHNNGALTEKKGSV